MTPRILPRTALATMATAALFLPFGAPLPGSCLRAIGAAQAAPSPTCASDLRECLRASADMHQTTFGGRYVPADDVAKCTEAFNACTNGGTNRGGNQSGGSAPPPGATSEAGVSPPTDSGSDSPGANASPSKSATADNRSDSSGLPEKFSVTIQEVVSECRVDGDTVDCAGDWVTGTDSFTSTLTGKLDGFTLTGMESVRRSGENVTGCRIEETYSGPITFVFDPSGKAEFTAGPNQRQTTFSGTCTGSNSGTTTVMKGTARWSAIP